MTTDILTQERLKELVSYDPLTGIFTRRVIKSHNSGSGCIDTQGYVVMWVDGKRYLAHRLVFLYMEGSFPEFEVDHINHKRHDNVYSNLRAVTHKQNQMNTTLRSTNTSGFTGVNWAKDKRKWKAVIKVDGKNKHLGYYKDIADAVVARRNGMEKYGFHMSHGLKSM